MAAVTSALTDELVEIITGYSPSNNAQAFKACKDASVRSLRYHRYGRTNQFNVQNSLLGLVEKFHVLGNDPLADALEERVDELKGSRKDKFLPEMLSLLLLLSDRPAEKSNVKDLDLLKPPEPPPPPTWDDIIGSDLLAQEELWEPPDYASSDEDVTQVFSDVSRDTATSGATEDDSLAAESLVVPVDFTAFKEVEARQQWRKGDFDEPLDELDVLREVLLMLHGLPSIIFDKTARSKKLVPRHKVGLEGTSASSTHDLLSRFADVGTAIATLRIFVDKYHKSALLQTFCATVQEHVRAFDRILCNQEADLICPTSSVVVSLLALESVLQDSVDLLLRINDIVIEAQTPSLSASLQSPGKVQSLEIRSYRLLDLLYEQICTAEAIGDRQTFDVMAQIFFACLDTYLLPVHEWMSHGTLSPDPNFPIALVDSDSQINLSTFWYDHYEICRAPTGKPEAPFFIHAHISEILASGKGVAFMHQLGLDFRRTSDASHEVTLPGRLDLSTVCLRETQNLTPFEEAFAHHLQAHITSLHQFYSFFLIEHLLHHEGGAGLLDTLSAFQAIYLSSNGVLFDLFSRETFFQASLNTQPNKYILADAAQRAFAPAKGVNSRHISAELAPFSGGDKSSIPKRLAHFRIVYSIPLSLQNIITPSSSKIYIDVQIVLLQLRFSLLLVRPLVAPLKDSKFSRELHRLALHIRHRLLHALSTLEDHILYSIIAPSILRLTKQTNGAKTVDSLITAHEEFIGDVALGCFVAGQRTDRARRVVSSLCDLGQWFAKEIERAQGGSIPRKPHNGEGHTADDDDNDNDDESYDTDINGDEDDDVDKSTLNHDEDKEGNVTAVEMMPDTTQNNIKAQENAVNKLKQVRKQLNSSNALLVASLHDLARSGASSSTVNGPTKESRDRERWAMLAERLEFH